MLKYAYIALAFAILAFFQWYGHTQYRAGEHSMEAFYQKRLAESVARAKETEKSRYTALNAALQVQYDELSNINTTLNADLDELRNRPDRIVSVDTRTQCAGASGKELSRRDASFLTRLSARADRIRAALEACYTAYDSLKAMN